MYGCVQSAGKVVAEAYTDKLRQVCLILGIMSDSDV